MTYDVKAAKALLGAAGFDAISAYAFLCGHERAPYSLLASDLEAFWEIQRSTCASVIPLTMADWDRRPRVENPVPWEHFDGTMDKYYETPTPDELAAHVRTAVQWTRDHASDCPAQAAGSVPRSRKAPPVRKPSAAFCEHRSRRRKNDAGIAAMQRVERALQTR